MTEFFNRSSENNLDGVVEAIAGALGMDEEPPCIPPS